MSGRGRFERMDVTPFIDVLLVLLILFMVVAPVRERALRGDLPVPAAGAGRPPLRIALTAAGMTLDGEPIRGGRELAAALRERVSRGATVVLVAAEDGIDYGRVVEAVDLAQGAGAGRIGLVESAPAALSGEAAAAR